MPERWLSVDEIAAHLGVNPDTIYKWINRKRMPAHKPGRLWKFMANEVHHGFERERQAQMTVMIGSLDSSNPTIARHEVLELRADFSASGASSPRFTHHQSVADFKLSSMVTGMCKRKPQHKLLDLKPFPPPSTAVAQNK